MEWIDIPWHGDFFSGEKVRLEIDGNELAGRPPTASYRDRLDPSLIEAAYTKYLGHPAPIRVIGPTDHWRWPGNEETVNQNDPGVVIYNGMEPCARLQIQLPRGSKFWFIVR